MLLRTKPSEVPGKEADPEIDPLDQYQDPLETLAPDVSEEAWRCHLWLRREDPRNETKEDLWCCAWENKVPSRDEIKTLLGGGHYRLRIQRADGTWRGGLAQLAIHGPPHEADLSPSPTHRPVGEGGGVMEDRLGRIERTLERLVDGPRAQPQTLPLDMTALIKALVERPVPEAPDPFAQITSMMEAMTMMRDLMQPGGGEPAGGEDNLWGQALQFVLEQARAQKDTAPPSAGAQGQLTAPAVPAPRPAPPPPVMGFGAWVAQATWPLWGSYQAGATAGDVAQALRSKLPPVALRSLESHGLQAFQGALEGNHRGWAQAEARAWIGDLWRGLGLPVASPSRPVEEGDEDDGDGDDQADVESPATGLDEGEDLGPGE